MQTQTAGFYDKRCIGSEMRGHAHMAEPSKPQPTYKSPAHFVAALATTVLAFSVTLATLLTILLFGLRIIQHGIPMCGALAQAGLLHRVLYTSCGCALVELILLPLSLLGVLASAPRLYRQFVHIRTLRQRSK